MTLPCGVTCFPSWMRLTSRRSQADRVPPRRAMSRRPRIFHLWPMLGYHFTFGFSLLTEHKVELQVVTADSHLKPGKGEGNLFRSEEWPSLNRLNGREPKWHRNLTQVIQRSLGIFLIFQSLTLSFIKSTQAAAAEGPWMATTWLPMEICQGLCQTH